MTTEEAGGLSSTSGDTIAVSKRLRLRSVDSRARAVLALHDLMTHCVSLSAWISGLGPEKCDPSELVGPNPEEGLWLETEITAEASNFLKSVWMILNGGDGGTAGLRCRFRSNAVEVHVSSGLLELSGASPESTSEAMSVFEQWGATVDEP